jgi:hypothetical protein
MFMSEEPMQVVFSTSFLQQKNNPKPQTTNVKMSQHAKHDTHLEGSPRFKTQHPHSRVRPHPNPALLTTDRPPQHLHTG